MRVFYVEAGDYDGYDIPAIFSTEEEARKFTSFINGHTGDGYMYLAGSYEVTESTVFETFEEAERWYREKRLWQMEITILEDGEEKKIWINPEQVVYIAYNQNPARLRLAENVDLFLPNQEEVQRIKKGIANRFSYMCIETE